MLRDQNAESVECLVVSTQLMDEQKSGGLLSFLDVQVNYASEIPFLTPVLWLQTCLLNLIVIIILCWQAYMSDIVCYECSATFKFVNKKTRNQMQIWQGIH